MSDVDEKLQRAFALIERWGGDADLLGVALLAIHGALEDHFRNTLLARPDLSAQDRETLAERRVGWVPLVNLMQKYEGLSREQRRVILEANDQRQRFAHGEPFTGRVSSLLGYGRFAEALCGRTGTLDRVLVERYRERAETTGAHAVEGPRRRLPVARATPRRRPAPAPSGISLGRFVALAALIVTLLLAVWLYSQPELRRALDPRRLLVAISVLPPQAVTPGPTVRPPATPAPQRARVARLGGGPGWLHNAPDFASGTRPIPLSEGMEVMLLGQQQADAGGTSWQHVSVGGYDGWCPANNLDIIP